jgi:hypothetical protein
VIHHLALSPYEANYFFRIVLLCNLFKLEERR